MKRGLIILLLVSILFLQLVLAETTFFEGDLGYRDDFIMASVPEGENIEEPITGGSEIESFISGGGFLIRDNKTSKTIACPLIFETLKGNIKEKRSIDYSETELKILTDKINQKLGIDLSNDQVSFIIDNFEDTCDMSLPLSGGFAAGRIRNLLTPLIIAIAILVLLFIIIIIYMRQRITGILRKKKQVK